MRYLITFSCYGAHLHGDECGAVDRKHNVPGTRVLQPDKRWRSAAQWNMQDAPYVLDRAHRTAVLDAIREVCAYRAWDLLAAHVRTNHVHAVVECDRKPELAMNTLKAYASRRLIPLDNATAHRKRWARHGSTRWLFTDEDVRRAMRYVIEEQGEPMAVFATEFV